MEKPSTSVGLVPKAEQPRRLSSGLVAGSNPAICTKFRLMLAAFYLLRSRTGRYYYGSTTDLARRLEQHGRGHTATTARIALGTRNEIGRASCRERAWKQERVFK